MGASTITDRYQAAERFVDWLADRVVDDATGASLDELHVDPCGLFWLGRLAPEAEIAESKLGERAERLEPCAVGMRLAPKATSGETVSMRLRCEFVIWERQTDKWSKSNRISVDLNFDVDLELGKKFKFRTRSKRRLKRTSRTPGCQHRSNLKCPRIEAEHLNFRLRW